MKKKIKDDPVQPLVESYGKLLDQSVIFAIAAEYDLKNPTSRQEVRRVLDALSENVAAEEAAAADQGSAGEGQGQGQGQREGEGADTTAEALATALEALSPYPAPPSPSSSSWSPGSTGSSAAPSLGSGFPLVPVLRSDDEKLAQLREIFVTLDDLDIRQALRRERGNFDTALDYLLNIEYLESSGERPDGIDGFFDPEESAGPRKKTKRGKKNKKRLSSPPLSSPSPPSPPWARAVDPEEAASAASAKQHEDVAYISERLDLPFVEAAAAYGQNGTCRPTAILAILNTYAGQGIQAEDKARLAVAKELSQRYRNVPAWYMAIIVQVAGSIPSWPGEVAALLDQHLAKTQPPGPHTLDFTTLTPATEISKNKQPDKQQQDKQPHPPPGHDGFTLVPSTRSRRAPPTTDTSDGDPVPEPASARLYARSQEMAASAAALTRRSAGNPLLRQAAAAYSDMAREQARHAKAAQSAEADETVWSQSTAGSLDLHGVAVEDGVRISLQAVREWWEGGGGRGEAGRREDDADTLTVITGRGRHSSGGVSKMRQCVGAALAREGWRMRAERGRFVVMGRRM